ncbi:MAG: DUF4340 domain-containing protein [Deltaproteobacteria bacterium]|nr:DUF4340 domain-containing protein [Deltaproteobacteria bacterium]MBW2142770.1 DUF4340 domain-containing protein [Deltaproteobacteria bacterium]
MSQKKIGILIVIFLILGAYVYFYEIGKGDKKDRFPEKVKVLDINPEDVQEIIIKKEDQSVALRMVEGQWRIKSPVDASVENERISDLLSFFDYGIVRVIDSNPSDLKQYGLDQPRYEFWIKTKGDELFKTLLIGSDAPGNISCYGKVKGKPKVVLLGIRYRQEIKRALTDFLREAETKELKDSPLLINRESQ